MLNRLLVIAPHIDDAELSCGGTMYKYALRGDQVHVLHLSASSYVSAISGKTITKEMRLKESHDALSHLNAIGEYHYIADENEFMSCPMGNMVALIQTRINDLKPDRVFIPLPTFNQDHKIAYDACIAALRPHVKNHNPSMVCGYEQVTQNWGGSSLDQGRWYEILHHDHLTAKLHALRMHRSQAVSLTSGPFGVKAVGSLAVLRGQQCNHEYAELFHVLRSVIE